MSDNCIKIRNISKKYKSSYNYSLEDVSFSIKQGDRYGILGPNGAGKTTIISIMCGVIEATAGNVDYYHDNQSINLASFKKQLGFTPQEYALYEDLSPKQNLEYFGAFYNLSKKEIEQNSNELLHQLGLNDVTNKKISTFSGGMKRRMNLAIGIIHKPKVVFLDEPTAGVDVQSRNAILKFLLALNSQGTTIIYTSHLLTEVENFCDNIALLDNGKLISEGNLKDLLKQHKSKNLESLFIELTGEALRDKRNT